MKISNINLIIILAICFVSCNAKKEAPVSLFKDKVKLSQKKVLLNGKNIKNPQKISIIDSLIVIVDHGGEYCLNVYKNSGAHLKDAIRRGKGPNELIVPFDIFTDDELREVAVYDVMLNTLFYFNIDSVISKNNVIPTKKISFDNKLFKVAQSPELKYVAVGPFDGGRYGLYEAGGNLIGKFLNYPNNDNHPNENDDMKAMAYQGSVAFRPGGNEFVLAVHNGAVIEICEVQKDNIIKKHGMYYHLPEYEPERQGGAYGAKFTKDNKFGFLSVAVSNSYIYLLYSGRSASKDSREKIMMGNKILVYDWNANPIKLFEFDEDILSFTVDKNDKFLYLINITPDAEVARYSISGYL